MNQEHQQIVTVGLRIFFGDFCCPTKYQINSSSFHFAVQLLTTQSRLLTIPSMKPFENIEGKQENADYQHFPHFSQCFQPYQKTKMIILSTFILLSANVLNFDQSKILLFGKEFNIMACTLINC